MQFTEWLNLQEEKDACYHKVKSRYRVFPSAYASGALVKCRKAGAANWGKTKSEDVVEEGKFDLEKDKGLHGWFSRNKGKGWVDCKASSKGNVVPCGREKTGSGAGRAYPACRPTLSDCNKKGVKRKKGKKPISWE